jgi:hypothetical protein
MKWKDANFLGGGIFYFPFHFNIDRAIRLNYFIRCARKKARFSKIRIWLRRRVMKSDRIMAVESL